LDRPTTEPGRKATAQENLWLVAFIETTLEQRFGLEINRDKTWIVDLKEPSVSLEFLGYSFRFDRGLKGRGGRYLNMRPSQKSLHLRRRSQRPYKPPNGVTYYEQLHNAPANFCPWVVSV